MLSRLTTGLCPLYAVVSARHATLVTCWRHASRVGGKQQRDQKQPQKQRRHRALEAVVRDVAGGQTRAPVAVAAALGAQPLAPPAPSPPVKRNKKKDASSKNSGEKAASVGTAAKRRAKAAAGEVSASEAAARLRGKKSKAVAAGGEQRQDEINDADDGDGDD
ncbi:hypothetical protein DQ04_08891070, partial [Trypanosoma grayi]|uniref:hypothetical protein n=1 Tax=Trypanosoma grayi TaxID=71804 RepID=UPI0004F406D1